MRKLKCKATLTVMLMVGLSLFSCQGREEDYGKAAARRLFADSAELLRNYTDSILRAPDSASVEALAARYEDRVARLNSSTLPETDYRLSEAENDSLFALNDAYLSAISSRLEDLHLASRAVELQAQPDSTTLQEERTLGKRAR